MRTKEYVRPIAPGHWFQRPTWARFMVRELTALFVAGYAIFLLVLVYRAADESSFAAFYEGLMSPLSLVLHLITLAMVLYHAVTWIQAAPQAMVIWRGEERVPAEAIVSAQYAAWAIVTILVLVLAIGLGG